MNKKKPVVVDFLKSSIEVQTNKLLKMIRNEATKRFNPIKEIYKRDLKEFEKDKRSKKDKEQLKKAYEFEIRVASQSIGNSIARHIPSILKASQIKNKSNNEKFNILVKILSDIDNRKKKINNLDIALCIATSMGKNKSFRTGGKFKSKTERKNIFKKFITSIIKKIPNISKTGGAKKRKTIKKKSSVKKKLPVKKKTSTKKRKTTKKN